MSRYKALWFAEYERILNENEDVDHELAARMADESATDRIAAQIDQARERAKYEVKS